MSTDAFKSAGDLASVNSITIDLLVVIQGKKRKWNHENEPLRMELLDLRVHKHKRG